MNGVAGITLAYWSVEVRRRILLAFEVAEREPDPEIQRALVISKTADNYGAGQPAVLWRLLTHSPRPLTVL